MSSPPPPTYEQAALLDTSKIQVDQIHLPCLPSVHVPTYPSQHHVPTYPLSVHLPTTTYPTQQQNLQDMWLPPQEPAVEQEEHHESRNRWTEEEERARRLYTALLYLTGFVVAVIFIIIVLKESAFQSNPRRG